MAKEIIEAYQFLDNKELDQVSVLSRLLWYLSAGGKRRWKIIELPDVEERNEPRSDYVIKEEVTEKLLTVEITTALPAYNSIKMRREREISNICSRRERRSQNTNWE